MAIAIVLGVCALVIVWMLYSSSKEQRRREQQSEEERTRILTIRRLYEDSLKRTQARTITRATPARRMEDSSPAAPVVPDNTTNNMLAAMALSGAFDTSPSPSHDTSPSHDSGSSYDSGNSSSDCGSSSYDSGSSSSDCGGGSSGGSDF